jgi:phytoene desaturase
MARIVVVGAGVGGLATAARLASTGHDVTVCEAADRVGGKLGSTDLRTGAGTFRFPVGPTLLTLPKVFADLFAATGDALEDVLPLRAVEPICRYRFADGTALDTTTDLERQRDIFDTALGTGSGAAWQRLLDRGAAIWAAVEQPVFGSAWSATTGLRVAVRLRHLDELRAVAPGRSLRGLGRRLLPDPRQRLMLERYATYEGSDPRRAPAALAVVPFLEHAYGAWYVDGGLHRLADALADRLAERGGRLLLGTPVTSVETAGSRVHGVRVADGARLPADVVVSNADAHLLYDELLPGRRRAAPAADSLSGVVLLLALRGRTPESAHHTVLYGASPYDGEFDAVFGRPGRPVPDPTIYLSVADDPAVAPAGHEAMYLLVNAPRHGPAGGVGTYDWSDAASTSAYADRILDRLAARGIDVRSRIVARDVRTPLDLERDTGAPGGAIYGRVQHGPFATLGRPPNRSSVRGLFLVGGSTQPGGGLPLVALSARNVAAAIGSAR